MVAQNGKTAIVTGGSCGIGAAVSQRLSADGFAVVVSFFGRPEDANVQVSAIRAAGGRAAAIQADVSHSGAMRSLFDHTEAAFGGVDVLVNNADIMQLSLLADADDAFFDRHVAINLKAAFNGMREAAKRLRIGGRVINLSSSIVGLYQPACGVIAATKAGVEAMTHVLANEMRGKNITVNAVASGPTAMDLLLKGKPDDEIENSSGLASLEQPGQRENIADAVAFLAGPNGAWVNGQILHVSGGIIWPKRSREPA